jgi:hypothetical protein
MESFPPYKNFNSGFGVLWKNFRYFIPIQPWTIWSQQVEVQLKTRAILWSEGGPRPLSTMLL